MTIQIPPFWAVLLAVLSGLVPLSNALACSVCQCGDYTVSLLGNEKTYAGRWRIAAELIAREEAQGQPGFSERETRERRLILSSSYSLTDRLSLAGRVPLVDKAFRNANLSGQRGRGLGDLELNLRYVLSDLTIPARWVYGVQAGVRLPTGETARTGSGEIVDIDAQPGSGSTIPAIGGFVGRFAYPGLLYATLNLSPRSRGDQDYEPAAHAVLTLTGQHALRERLSLQLALEARWAGQNRYAGQQDPDSGGQIAFLTPGFVYRASNELLLAAAWQLPLIDRLDGRQRETGEIRLSLTYDLPTE